LSENVPEGVSRLLIRIALIAAPGDSAGGGVLCVLSATSHGVGAIAWPELAQLSPESTRMLALPETIEEAIGLLPSQAAVRDGWTQPRSRMPDADTADCVVELGWFGG